MIACESLKQKKTVTLRQLRSFTITAFVSHVWFHFVLIRSSSDNSNGVPQFGEITVVTSAGRQLRNWSQGEL